MLAAPDEPNSRYSAEGYVLEGRTEIHQSLATGFDLDTAWELNSSVDYSRNRVPVAATANDQTALSLELDRSLDASTELSLNMDARRSEYRSGTKTVWQDHQRLEAEIRLRPGAGFTLTDKISAFWSRNRDEDIFDDVVNMNQGIEHRLDGSAGMEILNSTRLDSRFIFANQLLAENPSNTISAAIGASNVSGGLRLNIDVDADWHHDFPISDTRRGPEERKRLAREISSRLEHTMFEGRLFSSLEMTTSLSTREYLDQPTKDRQESRQDLVGSIQYSPGSTARVEIKFDRGFSQEADAQLTTAFQERETENRGMEISASLEPVRGYMLDGSIRRVLFRTDYLSGQTNDDNDDQEMRSQLGLTMNMSEKFSVTSDLSVDRLRERRLRAAWAAQSVDRTIYSFGSTLHYRPREPWTIAPRVGLSTTLADRLYAPAESTAFFDRRASLEVGWKGDSLGLRGFGQIQSQLDGQLLGTGEIRLASERLIKAASLDADFQAAEWIRLSSGASWRLTSIENRDPTESLDLDLETEFDLGNDRILDIALEGRYRPGSEVARFQTTALASLEIGF